MDQEHEPRTSVGPEKGRASGGGQEGRGGAAGKAADDAAMACLMALVQQLAGETDTDAVLRSLVRVAIRLTGAERGFVVLCRDGGDFEVAVAENLDESQVEKAALAVSRTLMSRVRDTGQIAFLKVPDLLDGDPAAESLIGRRVRAVACVPIIGANGTQGVMYLDDRTSGSSCGKSHRKMLELFALQAAAALDNARTYREKTRALEAAEEAIRRHKEETGPSPRLHGMVGASQSMQEAFRRLKMFADTEEPVVILGDTGTGKDLAARLVHARGPRREREFVAINCAGLAESLLEAELFGHERGAFTGADRSRPGVFEIANRGTLFLDEVGEMSARMQGDLLRTLQSGDVRRVGGRETIHVDVRVIAATNRDLQELVRRGEFRQDLYFRLNVLTVRLPPLRERVEDIPLLVRELLPRVVRSKSVPEFSPGAMKRLMAYSWPGNVRELENVLRRVAVLGVPMIAEEHLPPEVLEAARVPRRPGTLRDAECDAIRRAMAATGGNKAEAARLLGVDRTTLYAKLKRLDTV